MEVFEFEDDGFEPEVDGDKVVNVTIKLTETEREMFMRVAKRERRNMSTLGSMIISKYVEDYIDNYKKKMQQKKAQD